MRVLKCPMNSCSNMPAGADWSTWWPSDPSSRAVLATPAPAGRLPLTVVVVGGEARAGGGCQGEPVWGRGGRAGRVEAGGADLPGEGGPPLPCHLPRRPGAEGRGPPRPCAAQVFVQDR